MPAPTNVDGVLGKDVRFEVFSGGQWVLLAGARGETLDLKVESVDVTAKDSGQNRLIMGGTASGSGSATLVFQNAAAQRAVMVWCFARATQQVRFVDSTDVVVAFTALFTSCKRAAPADGAEAMDVSFEATGATTLPPVITSALTASGTQGTAFAYQIVAPGATSFGASGLPAGLSVNTATGAITGTPTGSGASAVTITATNAGGTGTATLTLSLAAAAASAGYAYAALNDDAAGRPWVENSAGGWSTETLTNWPASGATATRRRGIPFRRANSSTMGWLSSSATNGLNGWTSAAQDVSILGGSRAAWTATATISGIWHAMLTENVSETLGSASWSMLWAGDRAIVRITAGATASVTAISVSVSYDGGVNFTAQPAFSAGWSTSGNPTLRVQNSMPLIGVFNVADSQGGNMNCAVCIDGTNWIQGPAGVTLGTAYWDPVSRKYLAVGKVWSAGSYPTTLKTYYGTSFSSLTEHVSTWPTASGAGAGSVSGNLCVIDGIAYLWVKDTAVGGWTLLRHSVADLVSAAGGFSTRTINPGLNSTVTLSDISNPIKLADGRLCFVFAGQKYISTDNGSSWSASGSGVTTAGQLAASPSVWIPAVGVTVDGVNATAINTAGGWSMAVGSVAGQASVDETVSTCPGWVLALGRARKGIYVYNSGGSAVLMYTAPVAATSAKTVEVYVRNGYTSGQTTGWQCRAADGTTVLASGTITANGANNDTVASFTAPAGTKFIRFGDSGGVPPTDIFAMRSTN